MSLFLVFMEVYKSLFHFQYGKIQLDMHLKQECLILV